jgi:hypothetical protein
MDSARLPDLDAPAAVLEAARGDRVTADAAEARILQAAALWVDQHAADDESEAAWPFHESRDEPGFRVPAPRWTAVPEFAAALGLTTGQGQDLMLEAMELRQRLPRCWAALCAGKVQAWRVCRIAKVTLTRPDDVAAFIDARVAPIAHKVGVVKLDKILDEAMLRLYPEQRELEQQEALDARFVRLLDHITHNGVAELQIRADLADALDFEGAIAAIAHCLGVEGDTDPLQVRRSKAIGILADPETAARYLSGVVSSEQTSDETTGVATDEAAVDTTGDEAGDAADRPRAPTKPAPTKPRRELVIHVHVSEAAVRGFDPVGRLERGDQPVTIELIREWCGRTDNHVTVLPIRDLADHIRVDRYEASDPLVSQVEELHLTCVFPWCNRPARRCDKDHNVPYDDGGATSSCNLAPLCRRHHRLKTFTAWRYDPLGPDSYLWTSPHGRTYVRDESGTVDVTPPGHDPPNWTGCVVTSAA